MDYIDAGFTNAGFTNEDKKKVVRGPWITGKDPGAFPVGTYPPVPSPYPSLSWGGPQPSDSSAPETASSSVFPAAGQTASTNTGIVSLPGIPVTPPSGGFTNWVKGLGEGGWDAIKSGAQTAWRPVGQALETNPALSRGLMQAGLTMLAQKPSQYPITMGESLGTGGLAGLNAYDEEIKRQAQAAELKRQIGVQQQELGWKGAEAERQASLFPATLAHTQSETAKNLSQVNLPNLTDVQLAEHIALGTPEQKATAEKIIKAKRDILAGRRPASIAERKIEAMDLQGRESNGTITPEEKIKLEAYKNIETLNAQVRSETFKRIPISSVPGMFFDKSTGKFIKDGKELNGPEIKSLGVDYKQALGEATRRTSQQAQALNTANDTFQREAPELARLRQIVADKGLMPSEFKDINALGMWMAEKVSDPDLIELKKKTTLLADALQKTIGGSQGGQWAFEVAVDILNPTYSPEAFNRILNSHARTLAGMATSARTFGENPVTPAITLPAKGGGPANPTPAISTGTGGSKAGGMLPPEAIKNLSVGKITHFNNGQNWTMDTSGNPVEVK